MRYSNKRLELSPQAARHPLDFQDIDPLTTAQVARMLGVSQSRIRQFVLAGRLKAKKHGRDLMIERKEAERFRREGRLPEGRPASVKRKPLRKR